MNNACKTALSFLQRRECVTAIMMDNAELSEPQIQMCNTVCMQVYILKCLKEIFIHIQ
jgi:hypothetical protein